MARRVSETPPRVNRRSVLRHTTDTEFVRKAIDLYHKDVDADRHNIEPAREDMRFVFGDQWAPDTKARRERLAKPALTINRLPAFVAQYVGSYLQNDTTIKLTPTRGGTKRIAEIRQGLIRSITRQRAAKTALSKAATNAYICGVGNFKIALEDAKNDVFLRDIVFESIEDPFGVIWDRNSREPTGADAQHCFATSYMTREDFDDAYDFAAGDAGWVVDEADNSIMTGYGWSVDELVRVCEFWQMRSEPVRLALEEASGDVIDVTDWDEDEVIAVAALDNAGTPMVRDTTRPYAECYVLTGSRVLEGPYKVYTQRLPVFRMEGWCLQEANVRYRWGFVRNAKDPQRLHNFWRSIQAEELSKSVSGKWLIDIAGGTQNVQQFRDAHLLDDNVLQWNSQSGAMKPERIDPPMMNQAVLTEAVASVQDIRDVTNKHEASLGIQSNEVSGRAITARQRVSELGDVIYVDNANGAIAEAGIVINDLIPQVYDTNRTIKIMGADDEETVQEINGIAGDATPDITVGKYDVSYTTGPSYASKRQEAVDIIMTLMNTMPAVGNLVADILVRNMDIPGAEEIEERLATLLPPGVVNPARLPASRREEVMKKQALQEQAAQQQQQMQMLQFKMGLAKLQAETAELMARAKKAGADAQLTESQIGVDKIEALVKIIATQIDAEEAGLSAAKLGMDALSRGLEAATTQRQLEQHAAAKEPDHGETAQDQSGT